MKDSLAQDEQSPFKSTWVKLCLHLLAAVLLILAPILLARAQKPIADVEPEGQEILSSMFLGTSLGIAVILAIVVLLIVRKFRSKGKVAVQDQFEGFAPQKVNGIVASESADGSRKSKELKGINRSVLAASNNAANKNGRKAAARQPVNAPASLYGAYRIDQEVGKLVLGQPHRMDVMSSRASDDRRAIQASLIKIAISSEYSEDERRRAREALEEYGFVARESATLLLATDPFERTSAARSLGEIGSAAALPFLLEALHDSESIVRNQAVVSIGELRVPSAIGALLDMARKHPDVPSSLVSRALSACSVEGFGLFDAIIPATSFTAGSESAGFDFTLELLTSVEELPESLEDEGLALALERVSSEDAAERSDAIESLAQYPSQNSVAALVKIAQEEPVAAFRVLAVTSLAFIDHESVFPAVLTGMADESREVRAAAARALSHLSIDRSEAYTALIQAEDFAVLLSVARACVKAGIVSQNLDRLRNGDRRQAYEAFTLFTLLAKAKVIDPIVNAIESHNDKNVRLSAVRILACIGEECVFDELQKLAVNDNIDEEVKTVILEGMYKLEKAKLAKEPPVTDFIIHN